MSDEAPEERLRRLARDHAERPLPKRFYKDVTLSVDNSVLLDGRMVRTPMKAALRLPNRALAEAVAAEWQAQDKLINPALMPVTKYANTAIDRAVSERAAVIAEIVSYAGTDMVCYRAEGPTPLVRLQAAHWDPVLDFAKAELGAGFVVTTGVSAVAQDPAALVRIRDAVEALDTFLLTALYNLTVLTGSALLALMLVRGAISGEAAWAAAHVDEDFQIMEWGVDHEALARREGRKRDFDGLIRFLGLLDQKD